jgi:hypothetical protein
MLDGMLDLFIVCFVAFRTKSITTQYFNIASYSSGSYLGYFANSYTVLIARRSGTISQTGRRISKIIMISNFEIDIRHM